MNLQIDVRIVYLAIFVLLMRYLRLREHLVAERGHIQIEVIVDIGDLLLEISLVNGGLTRVVVFLNVFIASHEGAVGHYMLHCLVKKVALVFYLFFKVLEGTRV
jgi:hypothetical protein